MKLIEVLRIRNFFYLWCGQAISNLGDRFSYLALVFLIMWEWGGSALDVGFLMIFVSVPALLFGPIAGVFVDRWDRRRVMIVADILRGLLIFSLIFSTKLFQAYLVVFLMQLISEFFYAARSATIPNIVEQDRLLQANSLSQTTFTMSIVIGPVLGGILVALVGYKLVFLIDFLSFFTSAIFIFKTKIPKTQKNVEGISKFHTEIMEGLRFSFKNRKVFFVVMLFSGIMLCIGGVNVLFIVFAKEVVGLDIKGLGGIEASQGVGMVLGAIIVGIIGARLEVKKMLLFGTMGLGIFLALMGFFPQVIAVYILIFLIGFCVSFLQVPTSTLLQKLVPDEMRGRVFGSFGALVQATSIVSMGFAGLLADYVEVTWVIIGAGVFTFLIGVLGFVPRIDLET